MIEMVITERESDYFPDLGIIFIPRSSLCRIYWGLFYRNVDVEFSERKLELILLFPNIEACFPKFVSIETFPSEVHVDLLN